MTKYKIPAVILSYTCCYIYRSKNIWIFIGKILFIREIKKFLYLGFKDYYVKKDTNNLDAIVRTNGYLPSCLVYFIMLFHVVKSLVHFVKFKLEFVIIVK